MRIFDNPNHPQYGPIRRMWVVLTQLGMAETMDRHTSPRPYEKPWDVALAETIAIGVDESAAQRAMLRDYLERMKR